MKRMLKKQFEVVEKVCVFCMFCVILLVYVCLCDLCDFACLCVCAEEKVEMQTFCGNLFCCGQMGVYEGRDSFHKFFSAGLIWAFKVKGKMPRVHMKLMSLCLIKLRNFLLNE